MSAVVIITKEIDLNILEYYCSGDMIFDLYVVSPNDLSILHDKYKNIKFKNDVSFFNRLEYKDIEKTDRPNWYYQQFLKYNVVIKLYKEHNYKYVHIVDGDSFVRKEILLKEKIYYTPKNIEEQYQNFINETGLGLSDPKNFISNQMCFNPIFLIEMLDKISDKNDWISHFLNILISKNSSWFSEYQLYACFVKYIHNVQEIDLKVFRRLDLVNKSIDKALIKYSVVANEAQHKTDLLRTFRAYLYFVFGKNLG